MRKKFKKGDIVKSKRDHLVYMPFPNGEKSGIFAQFINSVEMQQFGYSKGDIVTVREVAITGDKFSGMWWADYNGSPIVEINQEDFKIF